MEKIGIIKYNVSNFSAGELFDWCNKNGVEYVELMRPDIWEDVGKKENRVKEISALLMKYGIKVSQISAGNDFIKASEEEVKEQLRIIRELCLMVKDMGFNQLRLDGGWPKENIEEKKYRDMVMDGIKKAVEIAEKEKVYLALDNHGKVTNDYLLQLDVFKDVNSKYLGANLDTMNYRWYGYPVEKLTGIYRKIAPHVFHTHMKDGVKADVDFKYTASVLGKGEVPLKETIEILKNAGYTGPWCIEYEGKDGIEGYGKSAEWLKELKV
ncbi:MAG TPA: sugar phosphate isomerase/epimerase family protein [bacterium]|nr:sugar phosphate isomerase/epimerase family protein [bacterium]